MVRSLFEFREPLYFYFSDKDQFDKFMLYYGESEVKSLWYNWFWEIISSLYENLGITKYKIEVTNVPVEDEDIIELPEKPILRWRYVNVDDNNNEIVIAVEKVAFSETEIIWSELDAILTYVICLTDELPWTKDTYLDNKVFPSEGPLPAYYFDTLKELPGAFVNPFSILFKIENATVEDYVYFIKNSIMTSLRSYDKISAVDNDLINAILTNLLDNFGKWLTAKLRRYSKIEKHIKQLRELGL